MDSFCLTINPLRLSNCTVTRTEPQDPASPSIYRVTKYTCSADNAIVHIIMGLLSDYSLHVYVFMSTLYLYKGDQVNMEMFFF